MGGVDIGMSPEIKILGLVVDNKLTFNNHVANTCTKALNVYKKLSTTARIGWGLHPDIIRTIYVAVIEPILMYAAGVWAEATKKLSVQKQLNAVQRGFAQKICKSYRTVSLSSALVLSGLLPLDLRIQEAAALYRARRGADRVEPGGEWGETEQRSPYISAPHPALNMDHRFICLADSTDVDTHVTQDVCIYTDGSKIEGKVGASLSLWSNGAETKCLKLKLSSHCTVYQAELLAIFRASEEILMRPETTYCIISDSRSSLQSISDNNSTHPLAVKTRKNLRECKDRNKAVALFWIKAHAGLVGNERADELAKQAALKLKKAPDYDRCPISFVKRQIRLGTLDEWNRRYKSGDTAAVTKTFMPEVVSSYKIVRKLNPVGTLTQVLTGHGGFSEYLSRFRCKENSSCICDPETPESALHILFECPAYSYYKYNAEQNLGIKIDKETASYIVADNKMRKMFVQYCLKIANIVIKRNSNK